MKRKSRSFARMIGIAVSLSFWGPHLLAQEIFQNYSGSITCTVHEQVRAQTIEEIQQTIQRARNERRTVRVVSIAAPRSYSPVICPDGEGIVFDISAMNKLLDVNRKAGLARVQASMLLEDLQRELSFHGVTFPVTPDYNGVSLAGAMGTGGHHSSLRIPSAVGDWVEELKLIDGQGQIRVLSGEQLNAARVHLGLLGAIYEVTIRVTPLTKLAHSSKKFADDELEMGVDRILRQHDYAKIHWFPSHQTFILDALDAVPLDTPGESYNNFWTSTPNLPVFRELPIKVLNSSKKLQCLAESIRIATWSAPYKSVDAEKGQVVGQSYRMLSGSCPQGECSWDKGVKSRTVEVAFPLSMFPEWVRDVKAMVAARKACFPILGIYLRFSKASSAMLGQAYGEDTVMFEIHIPQTSNPKLEPSSDVYDEIVQLTLQKYLGRPHWGKNSQPYFDSLGRHQFPAWEDFEAVRMSLDPQGVFISPFWRKIATPTQESVSFPSCAVSKECICTEDSDCGAGARCEAGVFFRDARVCVK